MAWIGIRTLVGVEQGFLSFGIAHLVLQRVLVLVSVIPRKRERLWQPDHGQIVAACIYVCKVGRAFIKAAEIAGLSLSDFLAALDGYGVTPFQVTADELVKEAGGVWR